MSTKTSIVDLVEDRWQTETTPPDTLGELVVASHLLGEDRRVANFGGGNTSAKGVVTDHVGREVRVVRRATLGDTETISDDLYAAMHIETA